MRVILAVTLASIAILMIVGQTIGTNEIGVKLNFSQVPIEFTCLGKNISPEIGIRGVNSSALALILDDPDAPRGTFTHWIMWNIKPVSIIPKAIPNASNLEDPIVAVQGMNGAGKIGYIGPCPPPGKAHRYFFRVYGLDSTLDLKAGSNRSQLETAMKDHVLQEGEAMATFGR